jgi:hypothetical protein
LEKTKQQRKNIEDLQFPSTQFHIVHIGTLRLDGMQRV